MRPSKRLIKQWNERLRQSGFVDIERTDGSLKREAEHPFLTQKYENRQQRTALQIEAKAEYFYRAEQALTSFGFKSARDWVVWSMHARGLYVGEIGRALHFSKQLASLIIVKLRKEMYASRY